jgi:hypothetical protein
MTLFLGRFRIADTLLRLAFARTQAVWKSMVGLKRSHRSVKQAWRVGACAALAAGASSWAARVEAQEGQDVQACAQAYEAAQVDRNAGRLKAAQEQLHVCVRDTCPEFVRTDCAQWLSEVMAELPSVTFAAVDSQGRDLIDVKVSVDGVVVAESLDGRAVDLDPGQRQLVFTYQGRKVEQTLLVRQGEKNRVVKVTIHTDKDSDRDGVFDSVDACPTSVGSVAYDGCPEPQADEPGQGSSGMSPLRLGAYIGGGVGVLGFGAAGIFKVLLEGEEDDAVQRCEELGAECTPDVRDQLVEDTQRTADKVTVSLIVGGVGLATGVVLYVLSMGDDSKSMRAEQSAGLRFDVLPTERGGLVSVGGQF